MPYIHAIAVWLAIIFAAPVVLYVVPFDTESYAAAALMGSGLITAAAGLGYACEHLLGRCRYEPEICAAYALLVPISALPLGIALGLLPVAFAVGAFVSFALMLTFRRLFLSGYYKLAYELRQRLHHGG